jgi:hypothetical protein
MRLNSVGTPGDEISETRNILTKKRCHRIILDVVILTIDFLFWPYLSIAFHNPFVAGQFLQGHGSPGM